MNIKIGDKEIGTGKPVFIIAEIGYNFNTLQEAKESIQAAKDCGVDAVKFQTFKAETTVVKGELFPNKAGGGSQFEEFKKYELSEEWHRELFAYARQLNIIVFSTPSHINDISILESLDIPVYKTGADDLTNIPFLVDIAKLGKPMIISTGMSDMTEVAESMEAIFATGNKQNVLLQTLSNYPVTDLEEVNLRAMKTLKSAFNVPVGFSDHTTTFSAPVAAVALGACVYERHFTIDKSLPVPDAEFSADIEEMSKIVRLIRQTEEMLGSGQKKPAKTEVEMRKYTRKSLVTAKKINFGETFTKENVTIKRPGFGIPPKYLDVVIGRVSKTILSEDTVITWDML